MECSVQPSLNELAYFIATNTQPQMDGCSNADRTAYIVEVLGCTELDLGAPIDYGLALANDCPEFVQASIHLAKLQMQYLYAAQYAGYISDDDTMLKAAWFELYIRKMDWHLWHLQQDKPTPPFQFIH